MARFYYIDQFIFSFEKLTGHEFQFHLIDIEKQQIRKTISRSQNYKALIALYKFITEEHLGSAFNGYQTSKIFPFNGLLIKSCNQSIGCQWCEDSEAEVDNSFDTDPRRQRMWYGF